MLLRRALVPTSSAAAATQQPLKPVLKLGSKLSDQNHNLPEE